MARSSSITQSHQTRLYIGAFTPEPNADEFSVHTIAEARSLKKHLFVHKSVETTYFLPEIHKASEEAQNALLKVLEEPPHGVSFILNAPTKHGILPTIISRCLVVVLPPNKTGLEKTAAFLKSTTGERLKVVDALSDRAEALAFIESVIEESHKELVASGEGSTILTESVQTYMRIAQNGNVKLQLSRLALVL